MSHKPVVIIYTDQLLPISRTFILNQAESLHHFVPFYVGSRLTPGLPLPLERTLAVNQGGPLGKIREAVHLIWRFDPALIRQVQALQPVLIHAHFGLDGVSALPLVQALKVPLLVTFHGFDATVKDEFARQSFYRHRLYVKKRARLQQQAALFIAVSKFIAELLRRQNFPAEKIAPHYIGIDPNLFQPDPAIVREPIVLFVGRLVEKKGCDYLIRAMKVVQATRPELKLVIIGDGKLRSELERQAEAELENYQFLGAQSHERVRAWLNRAKLFCAPSVTAATGDAEGFGIVFAEAQAMGLPVVSFATGGIPEAVAHGETGFLAPERDWPQLANYILRLLHDETLWQEFSRRGQTWVRENFDIHRQTQKLEEIYRSVIAPEPTL